MMTREATANEDFAKQTWINYWFGTRPNDALGAKEKGSAE
jgi:hypothetical protein